MDYISRQFKSIFHQKAKHQLENQAIKIAEREIMEPRNDIKDPKSHSTISKPEEAILERFKKILSNYKIISQDPNQQNKIDNRPFIQKMMGLIQAEFSEEGIKKKVTSLCEYIKEKNMRSLSAGYVNYNFEKDKYEYCDSIHDILIGIANNNTGKMKLFGSNKVIVWMFYQLIDKIIKTNENYTLINSSTPIEQQNEIIGNLKNEISAIKDIKEYIIKNKLFGIDIENEMIHLLNEIQLDRINNWVSWRVDFLSRNYTDSVNALIQTRKDLMGKLDRYAQGGEQLNFRIFFEMNGEKFVDKNILESLKRISEIGDEIEQQLDDSNGIKYEVVTKNIGVMVSNIKRINDKTVILNKKIMEFKEEYKKCHKGIKEYIKNSQNYFHSNKEIEKHFNEIISYADVIYEEKEHQEIKTVKEEITSKIIISRIKKNEIKKINFLVFKELEITNLTNINLDTKIKEHADALQIKYGHKDIKLSNNSDELLDQVKEIINNIEEENLNEKKDNISENNQMYGNRNHFIENKPKENARDNNVDYVYEDNDENDKKIKVQAGFKKWLIENNDYKKQWKYIKENINKDINNSDFNIKKIIEKDNGLLESIRQLIDFDKNKIVHSYIKDESAHYSKKSIRLKCFIGAWLWGSSSWNIEYKKKKIFTEMLSDINKGTNEKIEEKDYDRENYKALDKQVREFLKARPENEFNNITLIKDKIKSNNEMKTYKANKKKSTNKVRELSLYYSTEISDSLMEQIKNMQTQQQEKQKNESIQKSANGLLNEKSQLEERIASLNLKLENNVNLYKKLEIDHANLSNSNESYRKEINQYLSQINDYKNQLANLDELQKELEEKNNENKELNETLNIDIENISLLKQKEADLENKIKELGVEKEQLKVKYEELIQQQNRTKQENNKQTDTNNETITKLHQEIEDVKNKLEIKEKELNEAIASNTQLKENFIQKEELLRNNESTIQKLEGKKNTLEEEILILKDKLNKQEEINKEKEKVIIGTKEEMKKLKETIESNLEIIGGFEVRIKEIEIELQNKAKEILKMNNEKETMEKKIKQQEKEYYFLRENSEKEKNELTDRLSSSEVDFKKMGIEINELREDYRVLQKNYEVEMLAKKQLENNIEKINGDKNIKENEFNEELTKLKLVISQKDISLNELNIKLKEMESKINEKEILLNLAVNKDQQIKKLIIYFENQKSNLKTEKKKLNDEINKLKGERDNLADNANFLQEKNNILNEDNKNLEILFNEKNNHLKKTNDNFNKLVHDIKIAKNQSNNLKLEKTALSEQIQNAKLLINNDTKFTLNTISKDLFVDNDKNKIRSSSMILSNNQSFSDKNNKILLEVGVDLIEEDKERVIALLKEIDSNSRDKYLESIVNDINEKKFESQKVKMDFFAATQLQNNSSINYYKFITTPSSAWKSFRDLIFQFNANNKKNIIDFSGKNNPLFKFSGILQYNDKNVDMSNLSEKKKIEINKNSFENFDLNKKEEVLKDFIVQVQKLNILDPQIKQLVDKLMKVYNEYLYLKGNGVAEINLSNRESVSKFLLIQLVDHFLVTSKREISKEKINLLFEKLAFSLKRSEGIFNSEKFDMIKFTNLFRDTYAFLEYKSSKNRFNKYYNEGSTGVLQLNFLNSVISIYETFNNRNFLNKTTALDRLDEIRNIVKKYVDKNDSVTKEKAAKK